MHRRARPGTVDGGGDVRAGLRGLRAPAGRPERCRARLALENSGELPAGSEICRGPAGEPYVDVRAPAGSAAAPLGIGMLIAAS